MLVTMKVSLVPDTVPETGCSYGYGIVSIAVRRLQALHQRARHCRAPTNDRIAGDWKPRRIPNTSDSLAEAIAF